MASTLLQPDSVLWDPDQDWHSSLEVQCRLRIYLSQDSILEEQLLCLYFQEAMLFWKISMSIFLPKNNKKNPCLWRWPHVSSLYCPIALPSTLPKHSHPKGLPMGRKQLFINHNFDGGNRQIISSTNVLDIYSIWIRFPSLRTQDSFLNILAIY